MRGIDKDLISYLKQVAGMRPCRPGFLYTSFEDYYLKKGHLYPHAPFTPAEQKALFNIFLDVQDAPRQKQCFMNAQKLAATGDLGYAEGYVLPKGFPLAIHHAWATYKGKPVDVTMRRGDDVADTIGPKRLLARASDNLASAAYYGVAFPRKDFLRVWHKEGIARAVIEDARRNFPLLRGVS